MNRLTAALAALCFLPMAAHGAGVASLEIPGGADGPAIKAMLWTPCAAPAGEIALRGQLTIPGVKDCPVEGAHLPLIIVSHGYGGSSIGHHDTAEALADGGFAVVALNHPLDSGADMSRANEAASLIARPGDVQRLITYMLAASPVAEKLDAARIGFFGFSRGGYTGLMLAGAVPEYPFWPPLWLKFHIPVLRGDVPAQPAYDPRIKAFVIADPVTVFPAAENLRAVTAPLQLWASQTGGQGVTPEKVGAVAEKLPVKPEFHAVPNSTHLSFLMPCPPALAKAAADICTDPPGFDRAAFHREFDAAVVGFFRRTLGG